MYERLCVGPTGCTSCGIPVWHGQCLLTKLFCTAAVQRDGWICCWWRISRVYKLCFALSVYVHYRAAYCVEFLPVRTRAVVLCLMLVSIKMHYYHRLGTVTGCLIFMGCCYVLH